VELALLHFRFRPRIRWSRYKPMRCRRLRNTQFVLDAFLGSKRSTRGQDQWAKHNKAPPARKAKIRTIPSRRYAQYLCGGIFLSAIRTAEKQYGWVRIISQGMEYCSGRARRSTIVVPLDRAQRWRPGAGRPPGCLRCAAAVPVPCGRDGGRRPVLTRCRFGSSATRRRRSVVRPGSGGRRGHRCRFVGSPAGDIAGWSRRSPREWLMIRAARVPTVRPGDHHIEIAPAGGGRRTPGRSCGRMNRRGTGTPVAMPMPMPMPMPGDPNIPFLTARSRG
jgi:hypothetical protein